MGKLMETTGRLELWKIHTSDDGVKVATGCLYDDTRGRWRDGEPIRTSMIILEGDDYILTLNSKYKLGKEYGEPYGTQATN